jgi:hypothetical protein
MSKMIDKNYFKTISCFNITEYDENLTKIKTVQFKKDDDLNKYLLVPCHYWSFLDEIVQTIKNTLPIEIDQNMSFPVFEIKTFRLLDSSFSNGIIQRTFFYGKEWRRCCFNLREETWGEWINIDDTIDYILNNENIQINLTKNWDRYMVIDENNYKKRMWEGNITTVEEIIKQIKTGTAKIYRNKSIKT